MSPTIFSTPTNRRSFRGMVHVTDLALWQRLMQVMADNSRRDPHEAEVNTCMARSYDYVMDILRRQGAAEPVAFDPSGESPLRDAKRRRRRELTPEIQLRILPSDPTRGAAGS